MIRIFMNRTNKIHAETKSDFVSRIEPAQIPRIFTVRRVAKIILQ